MTSLPVICQVVLKNPLLNPSGPADLVLGTEKIASLMSLYKWCTHCQLLFNSQRVAHAYYMGVNVASLGVLLSQQPLVVSLHDGSYCLKPLDHCALFILQFINVRSSFPLFCSYKEVPSAVIPISDPFCFALLSYNIYHRG